ncbi:MAG: CobW family GTP-binding protein [Aestuariibacter sp.]
MNSNVEKIQSIPTNIITGFLGVGKTTAILSLLKSKPESENWAILVNEFGEIGIDGGFMEGQQRADSGVFIREVPGGCMCCTAGLPMQIALNQLLRSANPDRLLIEPTGLGHPKEVLQVLTSEHYREVLDIQKTVTLVDARKLTDPRYTKHDTFNQQIDIADIIVGNKLDLYKPADKARLAEFVIERKGQHVCIEFSEHGNLNPAILVGDSQIAASLTMQGPHHHHPQKSTNINDKAIPECGYLKVENNGEGYNSVGWRFSPVKVFDRNKLLALFASLNAERMKAVMITSEGVFGYNLVDDGLTEVELDDCQESRIEIIADNTDDAWQAKLLDSLVEVDKFRV